MDKRQSVISFLANNGVTSNLVAGGLFALPTLFIRQISGCVGEAWSTIIVSVSFTVFIGIIFSWINRREGVIAKRLGFIRLLPEAFEWDKYIEEKDISEPGVVLPRQFLQDEIMKWLRLDVDADKTDRMSRLCIVCGEKSLGRQTLACAGAWMNVRDRRYASRLHVYSSKAPISGGNVDRSYADANEWESAMKLLIRSFSKRNRQLIIFSDFRKGEWLDAIRRLAVFANGCRRHILFLVKAAPDVRGSEIVARGSNAEGESVVSIDPLTVLQSGQFVRKYAVQAHWESRLKGLQKKFESADGVRNFDRWCFACSGGRPKRLISFLENEGRTTATLTACLFKDLEAIGFDECALKIFVPFLWCLALEKVHVERLNPNGQVDVLEIVKRLDRDFWDKSFVELGKLTTILWGDKLWPKISASQLAERFAAASVRIPDEMLVASLGSGEGRDDFHSGVAAWLRSVIEQGTALSYVEELIDAMIGSLQCGGAYASADGDEIRAAFEAIGRLQNALGAFTGQDDADTLNARAEEFFASLQSGLKKRIFAVCVDGLGFLEDESVVRMVSAILDKCADEHEFLSYYHSAVPLFALTICNPAELDSVRKIREIALREISSDKGDENLLCELLPDFLCTALLCVFRSPHMTRSEDGALFNSEDEFVKLLAKIPHKVCAAVNDWRDLLNTLDNGDAWNMSRSMSAIMDQVGAVPSWEGMYVLFALVAVYMNDRCGEVKDFLWPRLLKGLDGCHFPIDERNVVRDLAQFPVMWRRAYARYITSECSPWAIAAQIDDAQNRLNDIESLSKMEVLRYLPELVRHFAQCAQAKSRGDKRYVDVLQAGWQKIQAIAEREDWFNVINRRARYWVIYWSQQIIRDAMSDEERAKFYGRLETLCGEIASQDNAWYHVKLLETCGRLAGDPLALQHVLASVESLVFDRYPEMLLQVNLNCVYNAWYNCVCEWFEDSLGVLASKCSGFEVMATMANVLNGHAVERTPQGILVFIEKAYQEPSFLEDAYADLRWLDDILDRFTRDDWNRGCDASREERSKILIELLRASAVFRRAIANRMLSSIEEEDVDDALWLAVITIHVFLSDAVPHDLQEDSYCSMLTEFLKVCDFLMNRQIVVSGMFEGVKQLSTVLSPDDPWTRRLRDVSQRCAEEHEVILRDSVFRKCVDAVAEDDWLHAIWNCPRDVLSGVSEDVSEEIFCHLYGVLVTYSSEWLDNLRANWFHTVYWTFRHLSLSRCPTEFFALLEKSILGGEFEKYCLDIRRYPSEMVPFLQRILEERRRRDGGAFDAIAIVQYRNFWRLMKKRFGWDRCDVVLPDVTLGWIKYFENALSGM